MSKGSMFVTSSEEETKKVARKLAKYLKKGDVILLEGPLGAGKTVFVKGVLEGLGFKKDLVRSPSFILAREYKSRKYTVYHLDLYRIKYKEELIQLGYEEYLYAPQGITLIEWAEKIEGLLSEYIKIRFGYKGFERRSLYIISKNHTEIICKNNEVFRN